MHVAVGLSLGELSEQKCNQGLGELIRDASERFANSGRRRLADEHNDAVRLSASKARNACRQVMPPTSRLRSRPPAPMACDRPPPRRSIWTMTSWSPVPEAPTRPTDPSCTALLKANGSPHIRPVPQSGPITSSPRSSAFFLSATSTSMSTLSLKTKTWMFRPRSCSASAATYSPGIETSARSAPPRIFSARSGNVQNADGTGWMPRPDRTGTRRLSATRTSPTAVSLTSAAMTRSVGLAASMSGVSRPALRRISLLAGMRDHDRQLVDALKASQRPTQLQQPQ